MNRWESTGRRAALGVCVVGGLVAAAWGAQADLVRSITVDGSFEDWADIPHHTDPEDDQHDTDHSGAEDVPAHVDHPDVDLLAFKMAHDAENLYAYWRSRGIIGRTQTADQGRAGRYYAIVTIDVDQDDGTGYWLHEGGYYPTSSGYDMNAEIEWYDGAFNTGHYLNHGARNEAELEQAFLDQANGIVRVLPGTYEFYSQWVMFDDDSIVWVQDKGPVYQGIVTVEVSPDGHEAEMKAPFRGFMKDEQGRPILALGRTIDVSFSLEASGELAPGAMWASDTAEPLDGYYLGGPIADPRDVDFTGTINALDIQVTVNAALGMRTHGNPDVDRSKAVNAIDVQLVVNGVLGLPAVKGGE